MSELVREATHHQKQLSVLRCFDAPDGSTVVEAQIFPVSGGAPVTRGPYRFASAHEAFRFMQEATLALQYLDCSVS